MAKKSDNKLDEDGLAIAKTVSSQLVSDYSTLRENQKECEAAYFMDWSEQPAGATKLTINPDPHNKVRGGTRLLSNTSPTFNVPVAKNSTDAGDKSSICEKAANAMWIGSNLAQGINAERDIAHSALLYGEMHLRIISTGDMLEAAKKAKTENKVESATLLLDASVKNLENIKKRTPFLFEPLSAMSCYARRSRAGLEAHFQKVEMTVADVIVAWGGDGLRVLAGRKTYEIVELNTFYDKASVYVWVTGENEAIFAGPHGLDFIPIAYYSPEGSTTYKERERAIIPFLYPVIKSGVWQRQNLFLSVAATNAAALMNAQFVLEQSNPDDTVIIDLNTLGGVLKVPPGAKLYPLAKEIINPEIVQQYQMYNQLMDESTIFDQTLGQPLEGNATFSATALMHQAGRLPLNPIKEGMASLFADAMGIAFRWLKVEGKTSISGMDGTAIEIDKSQIPEALNFSVNVDIALPTDKLQQAQTALAIDQAGLASKEWQRENILNIGQSDQEQSKIWREQMANAAAQTVFPPFIQRLMEQMGLSAPVPGGETTPDQTTPSANPAGPQTETPPIEPTQPIPNGMMPSGQ